MKSVLMGFGFGSALVLLSQSAFAAINTGGVLDEVSDRFLTASSTWAGTITQYASWLFWTLVVISMVWTFGMMALRKADIGEFFAEFVRFTIFTGFFWWLLTNGPNFAMDIINSLRTIAAEASGLPRRLNPSTPIDIAFDILAKAAKSYSITSPIDNLSIFLTTLAILACMAVVAANVLLALVTAWVLAYAGVFVLGFGGSSWTSDIALNYFRSVAGIALKLMTITLLVGIAISTIDGYHADLSKNASMDELLVIFVVSLVLVILVNTIPNVIAGLIPGGSAAASAGSSFGAGAIMGAGMAAASMAAGGAALAARATMGAAAGAMGGASAIMSAFSKASENVSAGTDIMSSFGSSSGDDGAGTFAEAAGFSGGGGSDGGGSGGGGSDGGGSDGGGSGGGGSDGGGSGGGGSGGGGSGGGGSGGGGSGGGGSGGGGSGGGGSGGGGSGGGGSGLLASAASALGKTGRIAADAGANLAKGAGAVAQAKVASMKQSAMERIADTTGGKIAAAIKGQGSSGGGSGSSPSFANNSLGGNSGQGGGGWINQTGGFTTLSDSDKVVAEQSHADWQAKSESNTFELEDYVSYVQERQQQRNSEVEAFVNRT